MEINYEWDENKRKLNLINHKVDFTVVKFVFNDINRIEIVDNRKDYGEERLQTIGYSSPGILMVVYTYRHNRTTRRLISARKANKKERALYNSHKR